MEPLRPGIISKGAGDKYRRYVRVAQYRKQPVDWVELRLRPVGVFLRERFIGQRWCLVRVVGFAIVGHGWNCIEPIGCKYGRPFRTLGRLAVGHVRPFGMGALWSRLGV